MATNSAELASPLPNPDSAQNQTNLQFYGKLSEHLGQILSVFTDVGPDSEFTVNHSLGYVPTRVELLVSEDQDNNYVQLRPSGTPWTKTEVFLEASAGPVTIKLRVS